MADITKCSGQIGTVTCPAREKCYRYTAPADEYQAFFLNAPIKDGNCIMYWGENAENIFNELKKIVKDGFK